VKFAMFAAFFLSTLGTYVAFPQARALAFLLAIPAVAAGAYWYGARFPGFVPGMVSAKTMYPGVPGFFVGRALPIDFICAGIPGAILGYYGGFRWTLHSEDGAKEIQS
jgi:hypothetical protein